MGKEKMIYHSEYRGDIEVHLLVCSYQDDNIAIMLYEKSGECLGAATVNLGFLEKLPKYCGFLDTNNLKNIERFFEEYNLGEFTGITAKSGYCQYPLYQFNVDKLRELSPLSMKEYERNLK